MKRGIRYFVFCIFIFFVAKANVFAGSLSIWASASNVTVGSTVTVSVKANNLAGKFNVTSSNSSVLSGGVSGTWMDNDTYTFTFKAKSTGSAVVTVTAIDDVGDYDTNGTFSGSKSVTLNVVSSSSGSGGTTSDKKSYSSNNDLSSLSVEGYSIEPDFSSDVTEYTLEVDESVSKINVLASSDDDNASITGIGEINLSSGENTVEVKVTAENGNEKIYTIMVTVLDQNPIYVSIDDNSYTIVKKNNGVIDKLDNFEETVITIDEIDVVAYTNSTLGITLVILKDENNDIAYYIYDSDDGSYSLYKYITVGGITLYLIDNDLELDNFKKYEISINDVDVDIYKINKSDKSGLVYGINVLSGNEGYYVYDSEEETLARYYDDEVLLYKSKLGNYQNFMMIFMGIVSGLIIIFIVVSMVKSKNRNKKRK